MKAFVLHSFGPPRSLDLTDLDTPVPEEGEVLVRVHATSVNPYDWHLMRGEPRVARLMGTVGLRRPAVRVLGADIAGRVEALGPGATGVAVGDEVYALTRGGGFAEYARVRVDELAPKPAGLTFEQAAAVPLAACTALAALDDGAAVGPGRRVCVNGATGGVGTFAVQLAAVYGGRVTGVCGPHNAGLVRSLGAAEVIDYTRSDFTRGGARFDLLVDIAGSRSAWACRRALSPGGTLAAVGGPAGRWVQPAGHVLGAAALNAFVPQRMVAADVFTPPRTARRLRELAGLLAEGRIAPVIDRTYPFSEIPAAVAYQEAGHAPGKVVVTV
ncbi:NAD(P)-dependent alcohol dehydrogenase [Streptomonospora nanhaiensis]|uniref:NAD(P)-dependent alcohol dehydrogenase n=1 Tax=Streptomonospora nanhaiensis TaxID=1323731 RepID=UPI001C38692C|nr:NAD(P)-dependent alcohol dehydrogenase [Streptomonospora nanhaiensis]MBV2364744.1 NAD(P)-dependent alcohol dehydrogenase [Streptomonospora nanhaiensis]